MLDFCECEDACRLQASGQNTRGIQMSGVVIVVGEIPAACNPECVNSNVIPSSNMCAVSLS